MYINYINGLLWIVIFNCYLIIVQIRGYDLAFRHKLMMCDDQISVTGIANTSGVYHFFLLGTFKIVSTSHLEIFYQLLSTIVALLCYRTLGVIPPLQGFPVPVTHPRSIPLLTPSQALVS